MVAIGRAPPAALTWTLAKPGTVGIRLIFAFNGLPEFYLDIFVCATRLPLAVESRVPPRIAGSCRDGTIGDLGGDWLAVSYWPAAMVL